MADTATVKVIAQRQFRVEASVEDGLFDIPGQWDILGGGGGNNPGTDYWAAGSLRRTRLPGPSTPNTITISRGYDPTRDDPIMAALIEFPEARITVIAQAMSRDLKTRIGTPRTYSRCTVTTYSHPSMDSSSGEAARFEIQLEPEVTIMS